MPESLESIINDLAESCWVTAEEHGFHKARLSGAHGIAIAIALMHSELSEALEAIRRGDADGLKEEFADVIIRVLDECFNIHLDIGGAIVAKMTANKEREYLHGKAF